MTITMNDDHLVSVAQLFAIVQAGSNLRMAGVHQTETYAWIECTLAKFHYYRETKKHKGVIKRYVMQVTGLGTSRVDKLIRRKKETGKIVPMRRTQHAFPAIYTVGDVALLAEVMKAHHYPNGRAAVAGMKDMYEQYHDERFVRLRNLSVSHLYNLKGRKQYQTATLDYEKTKPVAVPIGERRKPAPDGQPGFLRVDSVHQGDLDKEKGVYHINLVDEIAQWEIVVCVEGISEWFLQPALETAIASFPFRVLNFHSDNGSEYINKTVAKLLNALLIDQTKSRARQTNDNALVEGKNGAVVRKWMGHAHIPKQHAKAINEFYRKFLNPYLNFHRHCAYPTDYVDAKGKVRKRYETYRTPCQKLLAMPNVEQYLRPGVTKAALEREAMRLPHLAAAQEVQAEKYKLFKAMVR